MKKSIALAMFAALALAPSTALAAPSEMKVTGGGQIIPEADNGGGPGKTIAFTAQGNADLAKGQLQYNDHAGVKHHGTVSCVSTGVHPDTGANIYEIAGTLRNGAKFNIKGTDAGQGGTDTILFNDNSDDSECDLEPIEEYDDQPELGRGNVTIHKTKSPSSKRRAAASQKAAMVKALSYARASSLL